MRRSWVGLLGLGATLLIATGCQSTPTTQNSQTVVAHSPQATSSEITQVSATQTTQTASAPPSTPSPWSPVAIVQKVVGWRKPLPDVKPPKHPEELMVPPTDEARFSESPTFSRDLLEEDLSKKAPKENHGLDPDAKTPSFGAGAPGAGSGTSMGRGY